MGKDELELIIYLQDMISNDRIDDIDIRRVERAISAIPYYYNGIGSYFTVGDVIVTMLIRSRNLKALDKLKDTIDRYRTVVNLTPLIISMMLDDADKSGADDGDNNGFLSEAVKLLCTMDNLCIDNDKIIAAAAKIGRCDIIIAALRGSRFIFQPSYKQCVAEALKDENYELLSALTDGGRLLTSIGFETNIFTTGSSKWMLNSMLIDQLSSLIDAPEYAFLGTRQMLERFGKMLGINGAVETFRCCMNASGTADEINDLMLLFVDMYKSAEYRNVARKDDFILETNELLKIVIESGVRPTNITEFLERYLCPYVNGAECCLDLKLIRPLFPDKLVTSCTDIDMGRLEKLSGVFDGEMVFSLDRDGREYAPTASYMNGIRKFMRLEYSGSFGRSENTCMTDILKSQRVGLIRLLIDTKVINSRNMDDAMRFCVENKLYNVLKMIGERCTS